MEIGETFIDSESNLIEKIVDKTINSLLLTQTKQIGKGYECEDCRTKTCKISHGINCTQWFTVDKFSKRFKKTK